MTEEKRIIEHNDRCLFVTNDWCGTKVLGGGLDTKGVYARARRVPMTKKEFMELAINEKFEDYASTILYWYGAPDKESMENFWDLFSKPVPERRWYVKVPHTNNGYYHKWSNDNQINAGEIENGNIIGRVGKQYYQFTKPEIKKYHLEDCEKVPVDD
ncbi:hypothetical protein [Lactobacillus sp. ESL0681]|uniref:hypothetical protein n=1 Tax=Lactobacillus sp. ESL0681 TaxID=2983211 RepID=UPI0023FA1EAD|nr:hypothetical protein [Lactobacillus sp. ESL0681]WEV40339.1 hypothetical protein OZX59_00020 [Lactobacillus sp. ESL0681]